MIKNPPVMQGMPVDTGSIPGLGRSPGEGSGKPLQYSRWENPVDRGALRATVHEVAKDSSDTAERLNNQHTAQDVQKVSGWTP